MMGSAGSEGGGEGGGDGGGSEGRAVASTTPAAPSEPGMEGARTQSIVRRGSGVRREGVQQQQEGEQQDEEDQQQQEGEQQDEEDQQQQQQQQQRQQGRRAHVKRVKCPVCGKVCKKLSALKDHMTTHSGEKPHVCRICKARFSTSSNCRRHERSHLASRMQCDICYCMFTDIAKFRGHMRRHEVTRGYNCEECGEVFREVLRLRKHARIKHSDSEHVCSGCGRWYRFVGSVALHQQSCDAFLAKAPAAHTHRQHNHPRGPCGPRHFGQFN
ncbi:hypothetical protein PTSG_05384 [Salpingoeca rosetta]|uniref:C2H2-type domain-containing protein n=1 Tax=Salpingoeca rosetta (strain ATCC 50818 / BSB-021) TaxID=946362 RepID=F2UA96_SALR5|nr:uncharacterized protein PTSG_05384 [Salpingoeca rosetta]EGD73671.1 hypothetical protein PTSG_05384 [Salpingoeca rosetta]|eukprot:XP_004993952.1 hypothetical protein PTSG_05384 [Salpingoeca rosetta]